MLAASPERDEAEAQRYWRKRLIEHPEEVRQLASSARAPANLAAEGPRWRYWFRLLVGAEGWRELPPGKKLLTWLASQLMFLGLVGVVVVIWILVTRH